MRELAREEGELLEELVAEAGKLGDGASASTLDRVRETLQAAQVDAELAEKVLSGRVEREERAASVGLDNLAAPAQSGPEGEPRSRRRRAQEPDSGAEGEGGEAQAHRRGEGGAQRGKGRGARGRARGRPGRGRAREGRARTRRR